MDREDLEWYEKQLRSAEDGVAWVEKQVELYNRLLEDNLYRKRAAQMDYERAYEEFLNNERLKQNTECNNSNEIL